MAVDLSPEDALRLNVLLAGEVHAVRIDESAMRLEALTPKGEARFELHPNCRHDQYLTRVRELLGSHALDLPGGYPVYLRRWTPSGHRGTKNLEGLVKLGDPEAVAAVAQAPEVTDELARRIWWARPTMEIGRQLLAHEAVRRGATGPHIAAFLIEHLPFEEDPAAATDTIRAVVGAGLLSPEAAETLWRKGLRRPHYLIAFLEHRPDELPESPPRALPEAVVRSAQAGSAWARQLARCYSASGQSFLRGAELALDKPPGPQAVYLVLDIVGAYFAAIRGVPRGGDLADLSAEAEAMAALSRLSRAEADPILLRTTAVGPLMRRHLEPVLAPLLGHLRRLRGIE